MGIMMKKTTSKNGKTTIQLFVETRDDLESLGSKGETYDEIIKRLIKSYREGKK
jgi:hypothetical protein